jgi:hypothetical protein
MRTATLIRRVRAFAMSIAMLAGTLAARAHAEYPRPDERIEDTAYTLRGGRFSVGVWSAETGIFDDVMIGTYLPAWLAFPVIDAPILTGFIKLRAPWDGPLALSVRVGAAYFDAGRVAADISDGRAKRADVFAVPFEVAASLRISDRITQSLQLSYVSIKIGASEQNQATGSGSATTSNASLSALLEMKIDANWALTMVGRMLVYQGPAHITAHLDRGVTSLSANLGFLPYRGATLWSLVPGVAFGSGHLHVELGLGYGSYWLPIIETPLPGSSLVPEGNIYVRF